MVCWFLENRKTSCLASLNSRDASVVRSEIYIINKGNQQNKIRGDHTAVWTLLYAAAQRALILHPWKESTAAGLKASEGGRLQGQASTANGARVQNWDYYNYVIDDRRLVYICVSLVKMTHSCIFYFFLLFLFSFICNIIHAPRVHVLVHSSYSQIVLYLYTTYSQNG